MEAHSLISSFTIPSLLEEVEPIENLLDIGGGSGCYSISFTLDQLVSSDTLFFPQLIVYIEINKRFPQIRCTVVEIDSVAKITKEYLQNKGVISGVEVLTLNFFRDEVPDVFCSFVNSFHFQVAKKFRGSFLLKYFS
jgi:hypothetical protein